MAKTDAEWLKETEQYPHITKIKASIIGQLALKVEGYEQLVIEEES